MPEADKTAVPRWFAELLEKELHLWLKLSESQLRLLWEHYAILLRWNQRINLTSIQAGEPMVIRHYCESLFFAAHLKDAPGAKRIVDLGSGAGFPGAPMAILKPSWNVTLLESNQRKAVFLRESTRALPNISISARRAESVREKFDWLIARGVDPREVLENVPRMAPRLGLMLGEDDFSTIQSLGGIAWLKPVRLPWGDRRICVYGECSPWN